MVKPRKQDILRKKELRVVYGCGSSISWKDYNKPSRQWTVSVHLNCIPKKGYLFEKETNE
jgi:hypothetical protein